MIEKGKSGNLASMCNTLHHNLAMASPNSARISGVAKVVTFPDQRPLRILVLEREQ